MRSKSSPPVVPAVDISAEAALLGAAFADTEAFDSVADKLTPNMFAGDYTRAIFSVCQDLRKRGMPIDRVLVAEAVRKGYGETGVRMVAEAASTPSAPSSIAEYARIVKEKATLRGLHAAIKEAETKILAGDIEALNELAAYTTRVSADDGDKPTTMRLDASLRQVLADLRTRRENPSSGPVGVATGISDLDRLTGGMRPGEVTVICGRPGSGKSSLAFQVMAHASRNGVGTVGFSLEMPEAMVATRLACMIARVDYVKVRDATLTDDEYMRLDDALQVVDHVPFWIDDTSGIGLLELNSRIRRAANEMQKEGTTLGLIVIDYLQLLEAKSKTNTNRENEIGEISRFMKRLSKMYNCHVIAVSQLNRQCEMRDDKRPQLSDNRDSGAIEQDADVIIATYRDDYYTGKASACPGTAELIILKNRSGSCGTAYCGFSGETTSFRDLTKAEKIKFGFPTT